MRELFNFKILTQVFLKLNKKDNTKQMKFNEQEIKINFLN